MFDISIDGRQSASENSVGSPENSVRVSEKVGDELAVVHSKFVTEFLGRLSEFRRELCEFCGRL